MNARVLNLLKSVTSLELKQKKSHHFQEDLPAKAINNSLSRQKNTRVLNNFFFRNRDIYISKHNRFADYPLHTHTFLEMNYMLHGSATEIVDDKTLILHAGDLLLLDVGSKHAIKALSEDDILINILFREQTISVNFLSDLRRNNSVLYDFLLSHTVSNKSAKVDYLLFQKKTGSEIKETIEHIIDEYFLKKDFSNSIIKSYLSILLTQLVREYPLVNNEHASKQQKLITEILKKVSTEYKSITLNQLAQQYNYSENYLSNLFKQGVGKTFSDILTQERLIQAHNLISSTTMPITIIMEQVGISNKTFFYKKYKQFYHSTPGKDRKSVES
ncbi:AraC family transcriptional regulator [Pediococcus ethanolidurans]|nr:helix-turn-helix domain-containing protein [Pediococcus ethanolidurans]GEN94549.1 AraC family transcriptional regulator [Pediococcus ethanolidurans]SER29160.1 AraC-type DNA-binding domain and AraC-containing proteins [Pediococcus ethanolidurans]